MDHRKYWARVTALAATLPVDAVLVSLDNENKGTYAGSMSVATREYAARWITDQTHRLATDEEIERYKSELRDRTDSMIRADIARRQTVHIETAIPEEQLNRAVESAMEKLRSNPAKGQRQSAATQ